MIRRRHWTLVMAMVAGLGLPAGAASAHPHVWVKAASEIIYDENGSMRGVRHAWTFDDMFTSYALQGLQPKVKGVYSREELAPLAQTNLTSLKEFDYFTFAEVDGKEQKFAAPVDYYFEYQGEALVLHFTLPLETPSKPKALTLQVFDPEYFVEISLRDEEPVKLVGAPA